MLLRMLGPAMLPSGLSDFRTARPVPAGQPLPTSWTAVPSVHHHDDVFAQHQQQPDSTPPGDPAGHRDSSVALNAELRRLCNDDSDALQLAGIPRDVTLDLRGGVYRLDAPLVVNSSLRCTGTLHIRGGTLFAGPGLAAHGANHSFLVEVLDYWSGLGVSLTNLNFASNGTTTGGLRVDAAHHVHVQSCTFLNFGTQGIW
jgi:hypothetical protein